MSIKITAEFLNAAYGKACNLFTNTYIKPESLHQAFLLRYLLLGTKYIIDLTRLLIINLDIQVGEITKCRDCQKG